LYRDEDRLDVLTDWLAERGQHLDPSHGADVLRNLDLARARCTDAEYLEEFTDALAARQALDYPAMLDVATRLTSREWVRTQLGQLYRHLIIDEAQNLTPAQYKLIQSILGESPLTINAMLVGDPKQSIVQFAGADPGLIEQFRHDYNATTVRLTQNFRSSEAIASVAKAISAKLNDDAEVQVVSAAPGLLDLVAAANEDDEAQRTTAWIAGLLADGLPATALASGEPTSIRPEEIAVLARAGKTLQRTATSLGRAGIEYVMGSDAQNWMSSSLGRAIVDLIAFRAGPDHPSAQAHIRESAQTDLGSLERSPVGGFGELFSSTSATDLGDLIAAVGSTDHDDLDAGWPDDLAVLQSTWQSFIDRTPGTERTYANLQLHFARVQRGEPAAPGVRLLTVHKSQGREFRAVAVLGLNDGQFPDFRHTTESERRAELHCFYVAATRSSRVLRLSRSIERVGRNGPWQTKASEYLELARRTLS